METAVISSNKFNLKLLLAYRYAQQQGNIFYSPISITSALTMLSGAAKANTKKEMENVLSIEDIDSIHDGFCALSKFIRKLPDSVVLNIVNILAVDKKYKILPKFSNNLKENYNADSKSFDFQYSAEAARKELNQLIESATHKKIKDLFTPEAVTSDTRLVLANAIYFKGMWAKPFNKIQTMKKPFYTTMDQEIMVDMMYRKDDYFYFHSKDLNAGFIEIPYLGNKLGMIVVLPKEKDGLSFVENNITLEKLNEATQKMSITDDVHLFFPRFKLEESLPLKECLLDLGMKDAFTFAADFSGISGSRDLFVSAALHKAFIEVNEEGTEAAAATGIGMMLCCLREPLYFTVDHPFMFFIREMNSGLILFTGSIHTL